MRALAALGVVALHVGFYTAKPWSSPVVGALFGGLRLGVVMFFVLSAFVLSGPWLAAARGDRARPSVRAYLMRRAARILPAYYAALGLAAALLAGTGSPRLPALRDLPLLLTLRQNWSESARGALVPPSWTLCVELSFYVLLPLAGVLACRRARTTARQLVACACLVAVSALFNGAIEALALPPLLHGTLPSVAYAFAFGSAAAAITASRPPSPTARLVLLAAGWVLVVADVAAHNMHSPTGVPGIAIWRDAPAALGFAAIIVAVASGPARLLGARPMRWLADRSYAIYLFHYPVLLALSVRARLPDHLLPALALVTAVTLALAELSWRLVELPAIQRARGRRRAPRTAPALARAAEQAGSGA
jgi:peptidoglycan/LPS O-acetylase OafA/YrhL